MYAPGLCSTSFTWIAQTGIQELNKSLYLHTWVVEYRGSENVTPEDLRWFLNPQVEVT